MHRGCESCFTGHLLSPAHALTCRLSLCMSTDPPWDPARPSAADEGERYGRTSCGASLLRRLERYGRAPHALHPLADGLPCAAPAPVKSPNCLLLRPSVYEIMNVKPILLEDSKGGSLSDVPARADHVPLPLRTSLLSVPPGDCGPQVLQVWEDL